METVPDALVHTEENHEGGDNTSGSQVESQGETDAPSQQALATTAMEADLQFTLKMISTLVGAPVDIQNIDQVLEKRLECLALIRGRGIEHDERDPKQGGKDTAERSTETDIQRHTFGSDDRQNDARTTFALESVQMLVRLEENLLALVRDRELYDPKNDKELLGLVDQRMIHTMLEIVVCWGVYPCLLPGVGMPLTRRVRSNITQKDLFTAGSSQASQASKVGVGRTRSSDATSSNSSGEPEDRTKSMDLLWSIIEPLARITVAYSPRVTRFTTLGSILTSRHVPDLYAALLQLAYRPLPKLQEEGVSRAPNLAPALISVSTKSVASNQNRLTPGSVMHQAAKPPSVNNAISPPKEIAFHEQAMTSDVGEEGSRRARQLQLKEESAKLFDNLFWSTEAAKSLQSLTILLSSSTAMRPTPAWLKSVSGRFLSQILLRPGGPRVVLEYMQGGAETLKLDQLERVARLVTSVPDQMSSILGYYRMICPELLDILEMGLGIELTQQEDFAKARLAPPSPQLVQMTTFVVGRLLIKSPAICQVEIVVREVWPLLKWGTWANRKVPVAIDTVPMSASINGEGISAAGGADKHNGQDVGLDPFVASEYEVTKAVLFLHSFLVGNEPSPLLFQAFLGQAAPGLYRLYEFLTRVRSVLRKKVNEILVVYLRILDPKETVEVLKTIAMRRRMPVSAAKPWQNLLTHDGVRIGDFVEMGSVGESYFAPGPTGGAVLRRRSVQDRSAATQLELEVDVFLDFMGELETADHEGEVLGDLYMYLLDEYQAGKALHANAVSPRRMLTMLQLILSMTQKLGPSIMKKVTQIIGLANSILEHQLSEDVAGPSDEVVGENAEDVEETDSEILNLVLTLLSATLTENEHLSQQDRHLLSLTLMHVERLADHADIEIRRVAHDLKTLIPPHLSDKSDAANTSKTQIEIEMEKYASALEALQDTLLPVRAHGLHILREMILAKSIVLTRSSGGEKASRELDHALDIFVQHVQEPDSFIYLNAVKGLAALTDAHGPEILRKLMRIYANEDGKQTLDTRLRIGEALVQTVQRCGEALGGYLDALLPGLYRVMNTAVDKSLVEARDEEKRKHLDRVKAQRASEALLTPDERQRKWRAEKGRKMKGPGDDGTEQDSRGQSQVENEEEEEESIEELVDEISLLRSSALTILATAAESCPIALLPEMRFLVDWVLSILDLDRQTEVRRAATLVMVLLFRALGSSSLYRVEGDQLKRAYRTLRYVEQVDDDALCRAQARTAIADLDAIVRMEMGSQGRGSGDIGGGTSLSGVGKADVRYK